MARLILASSSPRRVALLKQIGYTPDLIVPADIDESQLAKESPRQLALRLAHAKALKISKEYCDDIILGADTVVCVGRTVLPKAMSQEEAEYCVSKISGRRHRVYTGVCVIYNGIAMQRVGLTMVKCKVISDQEKSAFLASKEWHGKAGGYALQGRASAFIEHINGTDTNVIGLPTAIVHKLLSGIY